MSHGEQPCSLLEKRMRRKTKRTRKRKAVTAAGYRPAPWAEAAGFSRQQFYKLDDPPKSIKLGRMRIITESPADCLARAGGA
jgi:hypothetical protein